MKNVINIEYKISKLKINLIPALKLFLFITIQQ